MDDETKVPEEEKTWREQLSDVFDDWLKQKPERTKRHLAARLNVRPESLSRWLKRDGPVPSHWNQQRLKQLLGRDLCELPPPSDGPPLDLLED